MSIECALPVSMADTSRVLCSLRALRDRAELNGQQTMHFVLAVAAESLSDNLEMASDMDDGND